MLQVVDAHGISDEFRETLQGEVICMRLCHPRGHTMIRCCPSLSQLWGSLKQLVKEKKEKKEADHVHVPHQGLQGMKQDPTLA